MTIKRHKENEKKIKKFIWRVYKNRINQKIKQQNKIVDGNEQRKKKT